MAEEMSKAQLDKEMDVAEDNIKIKVFGPNNELVEVTYKELESLATNMSRVTKIRVDGERNLNKGNFENEKFGQGTEIDFTWFWNMVDEKQLADPVAGPKIQRAFANGSMRAIGMAFRDIYVNHLFSVASRCRQLVLPQQKIILSELKAMNTPLTYDPFDVVKKDS